MIQELLGDAGILRGERKFSFHGAILGGSLLSSPSGFTATTTTSNTTTTPIENLRCPRCDSANTKFCYYNNYNQSQPRHFCKTCRRYWTKGGALRNVPIGGGCRKNKTTIISAGAGKSTAGKAKIVSSDVVTPNFGSGIDYDQITNPILWGSPQNSQLLTFLRATPNPNPNSRSMSDFVNIKGEGPMIGSHVSSDSAVDTGGLNARTLGLDPLGQVPTGIYNCLFGNNQHQQNQQQQQQNFLHGDVQNTGIQELYQRLRSSVNYYPDHSSATMSNANPMPTSSSSITEHALNSGGEFGSWNAPFSWSNVPATSGAYP